VVCFLTCKFNEEEEFEDERNGKRRWEGDVLRWLVRAN